MALDTEDEWSRICLYGRYGMGKTTALASAVNLGGTVEHIDSELRLKPGPLRRLGYDVSKINPHRPVESFAQLSGLVWDLKAKIHDNPYSVSAVGMDTITESTKLLISNIADTNLALERRRAEKRGEVYMPPLTIEGDWWGELAERFRRLFRDMASLETHLVFLAHERKDTDESGSSSIGPATSPAVQADLLGYVDVVGHLEMNLGTRVARFSPNSRYQAKDTFGLLPPIMANPTVERIVRYINEELTIDTDPQQQAYLALVEENQTVARRSAVEGEGRRRR